MRKPVPDPQHSPWKKKNRKLFRSQTRTAFFIKGPQDAFDHNTAKEKLLLIQLYQPSLFITKFHFSATVLLL